jgi:hypothetical protein
VLHIIFRPPAFVHGKNEYEEEEEGERVMNKYGRF